MHFVIAGKINCPQFSYAVMVCQRLKENLPDFTYLKIPKKPEEWERWLAKICKDNEWYHIQSPLIWREIGLKNGKKHFIGDINKFFDLCFDYYGVPREVLAAENFNRGEMDWFTNRTESQYFENVKLEAKKRKGYRSRQICITGASSQMTEVLIMELLQLQCQWREDGLEIRLFDEPMKEKKLASTANDAKHAPGPSGFGNCRVASTLKEALTNVDLVIVLDCFGRKHKESLVKWLKRNRNAMCALGKALNMYAPTHCRVIIGSPSNQPVCYMATVLASFATKLHVRNIVVVTQDLGRELLKPLSAKVDVPLKDFYCPPVWGFVGLNKFIDVRRTLQSRVYQVPGKRINSTLPQGREECELRTTDCLLSEEQSRELHVGSSIYKGESYPQLGRWPCMAKVTAILDLLKLWSLKQEDGNGEIISLGVYSDGTFNIPQGIYWSQPVVLVKGFWVPFADFPIPRSASINFYYLLVYSVAALYRTKVKPRIYVPPNPSEKPKEIKKFNFEKIVEEVGMPVIRSDLECAKYLKYLAKKELGIDFDMVDSALDEEELSEPEILPTEDVQKEQIFCECWRAELKELQKIVFDRPSSTEVEMDLSDNISGSEWSVINPNSEVDMDSSSTPSTAVFGGFMLTSRRKNRMGSSASPSIVCSCGALSNGSLCKCIVPEPRTAEPLEEDKISTEHFYKEQNAEIFEEDLKDVIYADDYVAEKRVTFDENAKTEDETGARVKFHGKKDAIRDAKAESMMKKRIRRYERGGEDSIEGESKPERVDSTEGSSSMRISEESAKDIKFHISVEGASIEIIGDQDGLEQLDEMKREKGSSTSFREMYADEIVPTLQVLPPDAGKSLESESEKDVSIPGEGNLSYKFFSEKAGEATGEASKASLQTVTAPPSMASLEEALDAVWDEGLFEEEGEEDTVEETEKEEPPPEEKAGTPVKPKRKREGIPLCCLCRCIVPEGLPCCPCGATTVVEVFKKESVEVFIQSEDDISYRVEYFETTLRPERDSSTSSLLDGLEPEIEVQKRQLPPESFFPFSPVRENKFLPSARPVEMTKEYIDSLKKPERVIPEKCKELFEMAKMKLEEENLEAEEEEEEKESKRKSEMEMGKLTEEEDENEQIKTDFSNLLLFIPEGIEDWRLTVQKKYQEWFFQGPKIRDECYYDIAIDEVSEEEFEIDKDMESFFEN